MTLQPLTERLWSRLRRPDCTRCPLHETAQTVCLLGDGPTPAQWVAIGEAPGEREDEDAFRPFAGAAGRFLDETLEANGISRRDFYVTNAAKCRPPNNRKPRKSEIVACNVYLRAELRVHKPRYVLLLGDAALSATLGIKGVVANRQRLIERDGIYYFVALHPASGLHRPQYKQMFKDDIAAFARIVKRQDHETSTKVYLVNSKVALDRFLAKLRGEPLVSFDIETAGDQYHGGTITLFGASFKAGEAYVVVLDHAEGWAPSRWKEIAKSIAEALFIPGKKLIAFNGKYDTRWFLDFHPKPYFTFDPMFAACLFNENRALNLENLAMQELHVKNWKSDVEYRRDFPLGKYAIYNAKDCDYALRLYELYRPKLLANPAFAKLFKFLLVPSANLFAKIEHRGIRIPTDRLQERLGKAEADERTALAELMKFVPPAMRLKTDKKGRQTPFNPGSSEQMARLLWGKDGLNLPFPTDATKKDKEANKGLGGTGEGPLKLIKHPISKVIERWRYLKNKVIATYFLRWKAMRDALGFVHFTYNMVGAVTGRISSDLHQTPRDPFVRGVLASPGKDWLWGSADLSQAEMRVAAHLSRDPRLLHIFNTAEIDVHTNTAMRVTGIKDPKKVESETRKKAKAVNFGFLFGMYEKKFQAYCREKFEVDITMKEARDFRGIFFDEYKLKPWHDRVIRRCQIYGEVPYLDGRVRRLPDIWSDNEYERQEAGRQAINSPVQGIVSDMILLAMVIADEGFDYRGRHIEPIVDENFVLAGQMHDEIIFAVRKGYEDEKCARFKQLMESLPLKELFNFEFLVPIVSEVKLADEFWGEAKEWVPSAKNQDTTKSRPANLNRGARRGADNHRAELARVPASRRAHNNSSSRRDRRPINV